MRIDDRHVDGDPSRRAALLQSVYGTVIPGKSAIYCSAPITSGKRFLHWTMKRGHSHEDVDALIHAHAHEHRIEVVEPNISHAQSIVALLRAKSSRLVIDPTALPSIPSWRQND